MKIISARRDGSCPNCKESISVGDKIAVPYVRNQEGGNVFGSIWYCKRCAEYLEECGPRHGNYLTIADMEGDKVRLAAIREKYFPKGASYETDQ